MSTTESFLTTSEERQAYLLFLYLRMKPLYPWMIFLIDYLLVKTLFTHT